MTELKILHINTYQGGGSGIAAMRLHKALRKFGYDSKFLFLDKGKQTNTEFQYKKRRHWWILVLRILKKLGLPLTIEQRNDYSIRKYKYKVEMFSFANTAYTKLHEHPLIKECDIIHLHWVSDFVDFESFFGNIGKPVVWTLHDMNAFLGGFHYSDDEKRYASLMYALDEKQKAIKRNALHRLPEDRLTVVTPSAWLCHLSKASRTLGRFAHHHIPNGIDINIFKASANRTAGTDKKLKVLFVAESLHNHRKGFDILLHVLQDENITNRFQFMAVGHVKPSSRIPHIVYYGIVKTEERISEIYNEADIFILPSREDNLPNSMVESLCCGTPVVAFAVGGVSETISNGTNGYLSEELSADGLKNALFACAENISSLNREVIAKAAQPLFSSEVQVEVVSQLYHQILQPEKSESFNAVS